MIRPILSGIVVLFFLQAFAQETNLTLYKTENGYVSFESDAPLELIKAESDELKGMVDPTGRTFAFQLDIKSMKGFNSPLQQSITTKTRWKPKSTQRLLGKDN
ncbi:MAG: hypothetical protein R2764_11705 [Bacteroidales bacterium]